MKPLFKLLGVASFVMISFSSCQKEFTMETDPINPPSGGDSIYLSKIYALTDLGSGLDTVSIMTFQFDANKRVILMSDSSVADPDDPYIITSKYFYNGNDTLPARFLSTWVHLDAISDYDSTKAFFTYNAAGKKTRDSILNRQSIDGDSSSQITMAMYTYATNQMYVQSYDEQISPFSYSSAWRDTATLNAAGDIVSNKNYRRDGTPDYELLETMSLVYDNKFSPFKYLTSFMAHFSSPYTALEIYEHMSKANILNETSTVQSPPSPPYTRRSVYQYNSHGLPVKSTNILLEGTPDEETYQLIYVYKPL